MRVENRGKETIPVPGQGWSGQGEYPPPQFHVQTKAEADAGKSPTASQWKQIESFGYGMKDLIDKSILGPGQAMEAFSQGLPGEPKTPPQGGKFRVASNRLQPQRHFERIRSAAEAITGLYPLDRFAVCAFYSRFGYDSNAANWQLGVVDYQLLFSRSPSPSFAPHAHQPRKQFPNESVPPLRTPHCGSFWPSASSRARSLG